MTELVPDEHAMRALGTKLCGNFRKGDIVLLEGELGAGKTTLVRGVLEALGYQEFVRSPTFSLIQTFGTEPPVMHADLYRIATDEGLGIEDYLDTHLCLIEWPDRSSLSHWKSVWKIQISRHGDGRIVQIEPPT